MEPQESLPPEIRHWTFTSGKVRSGQIAFNHVGGHQYTYWMQLHYVYLQTQKGHNTKAYQIAS